MCWIERSSQYINIVSKQNYWDGQLLLENISQRTILIMVSDNELLMGDPGFPIIDEYCFSVRGPVFSSSNQFLDYWLGWERPMAGDGEASIPLGPTTSDRIGETTFHIRSILLTLDASSAHLHCHRLPSFFTIIHHNIVVPVIAYLLPTYFL